MALDDLPGADRRVAHGIVASLIERTLASLVGHGRPSVFLPASIGLARTEHGISHRSKAAFLHRSVTPPSFSVLICPRGI